MPIPISLATNFDPDLPAQLARFNREGNVIAVDRVFGSLPADVVGSGRPTAWLPKIDLAQLQAHVAALAVCGIDFAYALNAPDLFGSEEDPVWRESLDVHLEALRAAGVRRFVVANSWLARYLRERPGLTCTLSLIAAVGSPEEAAQAETLGVEGICLSFLKVNRDLELARRIRAATGLRLEMFANSGSLVGCPKAAQHYRLIASRSRLDKLRELEGMVPADPLVLECSHGMLLDPTQLVRCAVIPPGYLRTFAAAGIERFKLSDRCSTTAALMGTLRAYAADEPVADLFPGVLRGGSRFKHGLRGLFPAEFLRDLRLPRFRIDGKRFVETRFIERFPSLSEAERRAEAKSLVTVLDPDYLARFLIFYAAVRELVAGRTLIPPVELPRFHDLARMLESAGGTKDGQPEG
jgi:collagenase-like PrtC family protease